MTNKSLQNIIDLWKFCKKYPNKWHTFKTDKDTKSAINSLLKLRIVKINEFNQFYYTGTAKEKAFSIGK